MLFAKRRGRSFDSECQKNNETAHDKLRIANRIVNHVKKLYVKVEEKHCHLFSRDSAGQANMNFSGHQWHKTRLKMADDSGCPTS